jgi:hypothetical protein
MHSQELITRSKQNPLEIVADALEFFNLKLPIFQEQVIPLNTLAMRALSTERMNDAYHILKYVVETIGNQQSMGAELISNTLNNMACFHLRMNHPHAALKCLERAYFLTPQDQQVLLNMCASLSALERHEAAMEFAK